jgi:competence protein ComEC
MILSVVLFVLGAAWLQQQPELPSVLWLYVLLPAALGWWLFPAPLKPGPALVRQVCGAALCFAAGFLWAALIAHVKLADHLAPEWEGRDVSVRGAIAELPQVTDRGVRFEFQVEQVITPLARVPRHVTLTWYAEREASTPASVPPLHPGQRWQLTLRLRRPHTLANPNGFDFDAWLLERGIRATGVRPEPSDRLLSRWSAAGYLVERARNRCAIASSPRCPTRSSGRTGCAGHRDQQAISRDEWTVFTRTSVNHLASISACTYYGVRVGFRPGAMGGAAFSRLTALGCSEGRRHRRPAGRGAYALLAGFAVPPSGPCTC